MTLPGTPPGLAALVLGLLAAGLAGAGWAISTAPGVARATPREMYGLCMIALGITLAVLAGAA